MSEDPRPPLGEIILYQTEDGQTRIECRFAHVTLWLSQALMAELFQTSPHSILMHLKSLFQDGEKQEGATGKDFLQVRREGERTFPSLCLATAWKHDRRAA